MKNTELISKIKSIMKVSGYTQTQMAGQIGVSFATFNRWLNQGVEPRAVYVQKINRLHTEIVGLKALSRKDIALLVEETKKYRLSGLLKKINSKSELLEDLILRSTYNSNAIEGTTFTLKETQMVLFSKGKVADKSLIEHLEVVNHGEVLKDIFASKYGKIVDEQYVKQLHRDLLRGIRADAGEYSKYQRAIRGVDLVLPHPEDVPYEMAALFKKNVNQSVENIVESAAMFHADFEAIHPFGDGNGRVGRLILTQQLLNFDYPPVIIENDKKAQYYESLFNAQRNSYSFLTEFICSEIKETYKLLKKYI